MTTYRLRKWAKACRLRDGNTCQMCGRIGGPIEVHHCKPKSLFPGLACQLSNGVSLCFCCHRGVVHAGNTFYLSNWPLFMPLFRHMMRLSRFRKFNETYQERI